MKREPDFDKDVQKAIESDPEYAAAYFEELMERPLPVQLALLRKFLGLTQEEIASPLHLKQTHISRLEKVGSDHLLSLYQKVSVRLGAHLAIVPSDMAVIPKRYLKGLVTAHV